MKASAFQGSCCADDDEGPEPRRREPDEAKTLAYLERMRRLESLMVFVAVSPHYEAPQVIRGASRSSARLTRRRLALDWKA